MVRNPLTNEEWTFWREHDVVIINIEAQNADDVARQDQALIRMRYEDTLQVKDALISKLVEALEAVTDEDSLRAFVSMCREYPNDPILSHLDSVFPELAAAFDAAKEAQ